MASDQSKVRGEGDYVAAREFQAAQHRFAAEGPVKQAAREAAEALEGPEGKVLEKARRSSAKGRPKPGTAVARQEHKLDQALEGTFPASDPISISPGSD